jgi:very-short-patch-repair endonuclease
MGGKSTARLAERRRGWIAARERRLGALATRQHGVITRRQLLDAGLGLRTIERRVERGQLHRLHQGVYLSGGPEPSQRGRWLAAVLSCGKGALLSHRSGAGLWRLLRSSRGPVDVSAPAGRGRPGIVVHEGGIARDDRAEVAGIPVTSVARTLFDLAEVLDERRLGRAWEEADRLKLLVIPEVEAVCARGYGRRALRPIRRLIEEARASETTNSPLEDLVIELCREYDLPMPATNVQVLGREVDAFWPSQKLMVEADSYEYHGHRAAFERDRERDAVMQVEGYRVIRLTHRRMEREPEAVATQLRRLLEPSSATLGSGNSRRELGRAGT